MKENGEERKEGETKFGTTRNLRRNHFFSLSDLDCDDKDGICLTKYNKMH